jgi:hypothetical protein
MSGVKVPVTYEDWLNCFDELKASSTVDNEFLEAVTGGWFVSSQPIAAGFRQRLAETINQMLNKRILRFVKDLNLLISFNELSDIVPLFVKFRGEANRCLFFTELKFLDADFKRELEQSVKKQTEDFWHDTIIFLQRQTEEFHNAKLEDSLFLIRRIELFSKVTNG